MQVPASAAQGSSGLQYKWIVTMVVIFGAFMSILDQTIVNIAIPRLQNAFGADLNSVQWVLTAYILTQGVVTPTTAFFADRLGTKRFYILALAIFTAGSALCGLAWSLPVLIVFRVLQGVGGAALFPLAITLLYREFPLQQRGLASGLLGIAALLAPAVGPTLGGYFVTYVNWQLIFFVNVPIGIVGIVLAVILLREVQAGTRAQFDVPGFVLVATGLAAVLYALSDASTDGWGSGKVLGFLIGGLIILGFFVFVEVDLARREKQPLLDLRLFANGPFLSSNIANVLITFAFFGGIFLFPIYLQNLRGLNAFSAGLLLLPQAFASIITALIGGRVVDRLGVRVVVIPGLVLLAYATWQLNYLTLFTPYWWLQVLFVIRGLALGLIIQPLNVSALSDIHPRQLTQASTLYTVLRFVSTSLGIAVLATLVQTQAKIHYGHLAEQVTPASPLGQVASRLQSLFVQRGASLNDARGAAIQEVARLVQRQGYMLAIQDAFRLVLFVLIAAIIATCFIRMRKYTPPVSQQVEQDAGSEVEKLEAMIPG
ncbi:MAG TPA: MDR family MFS transporter [Ktedonobacteraceae bacterium]